MGITRTTGLVIVGSAVATFAVVWFGTTLMRRARRGMPGAASFGWVLLFLTSGRMPPPPPASQIEAELNTEKDRLVARKQDGGGQKSAVVRCGPAWQDPSRS